MDGNSGNILNKKLPAGETLNGIKRTMMCAEVSEADIDNEVLIMGWVNKARNLGSMIFAVIRDRTGLLQTVFREENDPELYEKASLLRGEYVVAVRGTVRHRGEGAVNKDMPTGSIEVEASELKILSCADTPPIYIVEDLDAGELLRLKYRYLDLRRPDMQKNLLLRHRVVRSVREFYNDAGFIDVETPVLTRSTPEGARDYLVPSRIRKGAFYALPQSPQLFKQLLMVSGIDRYYQIAKCFRDEDLRVDRQPEFTQIDVEMSFVEPSDVMEINEKMIRKVFSEILGLEFTAPFIKMKYSEAMQRYGSDKPDTRFGMELADITDIAAGTAFRVFSEAAESGGSIKCININGGASFFKRKDIDSLTEYARTYKAKGLTWISFDGDGGIRSSAMKFLAETEIRAIASRAGSQQGDLILIAADKNKIVYDVLGQLRNEVAARMGMISPGTYSFLWVTEFPMFEYNDEENRWDPKHHPFTAPMDEDTGLLDSDPGKVRAKAYDIILNGNEIGGGSIRIHDRVLQEKIFTLLGMSDKETAEKFGFLLQAFRYGTPPHGGIAFGLDRIIMLMAGASSIRDVIAFPKVQNASCPMTEAPAC
ncbi:MAG: aspartate--tRNA ligase, partial [Eubacteriales bacterium]|nr:aspartate--tRNA ligase [Eubacteriales bacterium]